MEAKAGASTWPCELYLKVPVVRFGPPPSREKPPPYYPGALWPLKGLGDLSRGLGHGLHAIQRGTGLRGCVEEREGHLGYKGLQSHNWPMTYMLYYILYC